MNDNSIMKRLFGIIFYILICNISIAQDTIIEDGFVHIKTSTWIVKYQYIDSINEKHGTYEYRSVGMSKSYMQLGQYRHGLKYGSWQYFIDENLHYTSNYKSNNLHGKYVEYAENKKIKEITYKNGLRRGCAKYYIDGKLVAKGKYSGDFVEIEYDSSNVTFQFSTGKELSYELSDTSSINSVYRKYSLYVPYKQSWLRKGTWLYYNPSGLVVEKLKYDNNGCLKKRIRKSETDIENKLIW